MALAERRDDKGEEERAAAAEESPDEDFNEDAGEYLQHLTWRGLLWMPQTYVQSSARLRGLRGRG